MTYTAIYSTYHNDKFINCTQCTLKADTKPNDETIELTWDNLAEYYTKNGLFVSFNIWNFKKGRLVSFFNDRHLPFGDYADVKEWKTADLNIKIKVKYFEKRD